MNRAEFTSELIRNIKLLEYYCVKSYGTKDDDLIQETVTRALECRANYNGSCKLLTWLIAIMKNVKKEEKDIIIRNDIPTKECFQECLYDEEILKQRLISANNKLTPAQKEVMMMYTQGLGIKAMAVASGKSSNCIKAIIYNARKTISDTIKWAS